MPLLPDSLGLVPSQVVLEQALVESVAAHRAHGQHGVVGVRAGRDQADRGGRAHDRKVLKRSQEDEEEALTSVQKGETTFSA